MAWDLNTHARSLSNTYGVASFVSFGEGAMNRTAVLRLVYSRYRNQALSLKNMIMVISLHMQKLE